jgi:predicted RNA-binding Zn-ribbon protein involved in translation (DUF1610 family)
MLKFECQHCGRRIAVPSGKLGKLVTCSECGMQTHPLAEQIVAAGAGRAAASATAEVATPARVTPQAATAPGHCDNCGALIGRLETTHAWNDHSICGGCYGRLSGVSGIAGVGPVSVARRPAVVVDPVGAGAAAASSYAAGPDSKPIMLDLRERVLRALIVFVVASVALYGALSLLRDIAGLIAVAAVAVIALLALYAVFRGTLAARRGAATSMALTPVRRSAS